jgi:hypothetical protein
MVTTLSKKPRYWAGVITFLPGADRRRTLASYLFRLTYYNPDPEKLGCLMTWEVEGGRLPYQVAVERLSGGRLRLHCTCADAVFRAEPNGKRCKHVEAFVQIGRKMLEEMRGERAA